MKIFIMAYARKNLGDDLFIKMLLEKYNNIDFFIKISDYNFLSVLDKYENLHVMKGNDTDEELSKMNPEEYDAYVYIGGSIFMEDGKVLEAASAEEFFESPKEERTKAFLNHILSKDK